jgi:hypothetical protein
MSETMRERFRCMSRLAHACSFKWFALVVSLSTFGTRIWFNRREGRSLDCKRRLTLEDPKGPLRVLVGFPQQGGGIPACGRTLGVCQHFT